MQTVLVDFRVRVTSQDEVEISILETAPHGSIMQSQFVLTPEKCQVLHLALTGALHELRARSFLKHAEFTRTVTTELQKAEAA